MNNLERFEIIELFDLYENLLTEKQQEYFKASYFEDYSLAEIAENFSVSRAAVYDAIQKIIKELINYEQKLHLKAKQDQRKKLIEKISNKELRDEFLEFEGLQE